MKRLQVMDLFHGKETEPQDADWKEAKDQLPNVKSCKVLVKASNGNESFAYYFNDKGDFSNIGGEDFSYFWCCSKKEPLHNVIAWKPLKENNER